MKVEVQDKLEAAVMNYVDGLPLDSLVEWVTNDVWQYYRKSADEEEVKTFIEESLSEIIVDKMGNTQ